MIEKITLDMLTLDGVSVKTQRFFDDNGTLYAIGQPHRKAFANSIEGRQEVQNELPIEQQNAIVSIWGDSPTITNSDV